MPIHNWSRVSDGMFHWFHQLWVVSTAQWLNEGRLPESCYAIGELYADHHYPDVLAVEDRPSDNGKPDWSPTNGAGVAIAEARPKTRFCWTTETTGYLAKKNLLAIRNVDGILLAVIEIVSPGNKSSQARFDAFVTKTIDFLEQGVHVLVIDLFPPTRRDPHGMHQEIWRQWQDGEFDFEPDKPLTLAAYTAVSADAASGAYVEPVTIGDRMPAMPLFLTPAYYINVDLEATYMNAWAVYPAPLKPKVEVAAATESP